MKVLISGSFDLIHSGHILAFQKAKSYGDYLIVNVVPAERVKAKKGEGRPILSDKERIFNLSHIDVIDKVVSIPFKEGMTKLDYEKVVLKEVQPDIVVQKIHNKELEKFCQQLGIGMIKFRVCGIDGIHTTDIINKINEKDTGQKHKYSREIL